MDCTHCTATSGDAMERFTCAHLNPKLPFFILLETPHGGDVQTRKRSAHVNSSYVALRRYDSAPGISEDRVLLKTR